MRGEDYPESATSGRQAHQARAFLLEVRLGLFESEESDFHCLRQGQDDGFLLAFAPSNIHQAPDPLC